MPCRPWGDCISSPTPDPGATRSPWSGPPSRWPRADLVVQVRVEDAATDREAYDLARRVLALCAPYGATCLVNDRLHVALAVGAAGGHVGADDLPVAAARRVLGPAGVLGATARDAADGAPRRSPAGASYLGVGPVHATSTKTGLPDPIGPGRGTRRRRRRATYRSSRSAG